VLLGRERELEHLEELMARLLSGSGGTALLEGPAGIGKTALLGEAATRARAHGFLVLRATGAELEREYAYGVARQLFAPALAPPGEAGDLFEGPASLAAGPLRVAATADVPGGTGDAVATAMHGLYWLTANLSEQAPLVLLLDDGHGRTRCRCGLCCISLAGWRIFLWWC
jgi:hypothetical protein